MPANPAIARRIDDGSGVAVAYVTCTISPPEFAIPVGAPGVAKTLLITQFVAGLQSITSNSPPPVAEKLVNCKSIRSAPFAGLYRNGVVNTILVPKAQGPGPEHAAKVSVVLPENTCVLS